MKFCDILTAPSGASGIELCKFLDKEKFPKMRDFGLLIICLESANVNSLI